MADELNNLISKIKKAFNGVQINEKKREYNI